MDANRIKMELYWAEIHQQRTQKKNFEIKCGMSWIEVDCNSSKLTSDQ